MISNLNNGFLQQEIQDVSEKIFVLGDERKGGSAPLPRRKDKKIPERIEYLVDKPIIQVSSVVLAAVAEEVYIESKSTLV